MNRYSSDSDESIEHMKLDLLKAKYVHQKLNKNGPKSYNNAPNNVVSLKKGLKPQLSTSNLGIINRSTDRPKLSEASDVQYNESDCSKDEEDADINRMNDYVDSLLFKRGVTSPNPTPTDSSPKPIISSQAPTAGGYKEDNGDCSQAYNPSTDILAQWRLRRKLSEAKHFVRSEHQKHNLQINSLHNSVDQRFHSPHNPQPLNSFVRNECEDEPARDVSVERSMPKTLTSTTETYPKVIVVDSGSQCDMDAKVVNKLSKNEGNVDKKSTKPKCNRKSKRSVGIMAEIMPHGDRSSQREGGTQTEPLNDPHHVHNGARYSEWEGQGSDRDYIDMAIQRTLQTQLFDRNCSSALSTVTSLNESQNSPMSVVKPHPEDSTFINGDNTLPWNESYQVESDDDFSKDDLLVDLRKRRALNLEKLRTLSLQIQRSTGRLPINIG